MKFALAILASTVYAVKTRQDDDTDWGCYGEWEWEDCSGLWWQSDWCTNDCGWWYSPDLDDDWSDDWWVSCDEWDTWEECSASCDNEWEWDEYFYEWWRFPCDWEYESDCGYIVWDEWWEEEYYVDCSWYEEW